MVVEGTVVEAAGVETTTVVLFKESDTTRIGIGLRADVPCPRIEEWTDGDDDRRAASRRVPSASRGDKFGHT